MADSSHKNPEMMLERYDSPEVLEQKVDQLVEYIQESNHMVCFTGAGISTSAGIPDFRGPQGKWTLEAQGKQCVMKVQPVSAFPTDTHMSLVKLQQDGVLKYLISQNCDGLHIRSGFPSARISELHGNGNIEMCENCGQRYFRDLACHRKHRHRDHWTGRHCSRPGCRGRLLGYTIDFGQNLPEDPLERAEFHSDKADLHVVLGSSLTVQPACTMPETTKSNGGRLVIINLQLTGLTPHSDLHIHAKTDDVMRMVMERLGKPIPQFRLHRKLIVGMDPISANTHRLYLRGADVEDPSLEMHFVESAVWGKPQLSERQGIDIAPELYETEVPVNPHMGEMTQAGRDLSLPLLDAPAEASEILVPVEIAFKGHYREPNIVLLPDFTYGIKQNIRYEYLYSLTYDPYTFEWTSECCPSLVEPDRTVRDLRYAESHRDYVVTGLMKTQHWTRSKARSYFDRFVQQNQKQLTALRN